MCGEKEEGEEGKESGGKKDIYNPKTGLHGI